MVPPVLCECIYNTENVIVFTPQPSGYCFHPWCPDGRSGRQREEVCPACISETARCRKLGHWLAVVGVQCHGVTLI